MANARLKFDDNEITLGEGVTTLGRATDNTVSFSSDSNVSRYHAEIEWRDDDFWLIDLGSSNGTTLNGERISGDKRLNGGDVILLGGTSKAEFLTEEKPVEEEASVAARNESEVTAAQVEQQNKQEEEVAQDAEAIANSKMPLMLGIAGAACGLAVVAMVAVAIYSFTGTGTTRCEAQAVISKPANGETITETTEIEVEAQNADCAARAIFLLNGAEFASASEQPFTATLDPKQFPELANGMLQTLQIVLEDEEGNKIVQPNEVSLAFETIEIATPTPTPVEVAEEPTPTPAKGQKATLIETQEMAKRLLKEFSGNFNYNVSDQQFLQEVQKRTAEYTAAENYFARAAQYKDVINVSFKREQDVDAPLGYVLAMSRSRFNPQKQGADEGLWQMSDTFVADNALGGQCGAETLSDNAQNCAAKAAALYMKSLILGVFEGDVVYGVAAFGKSPQEANIWKATLPADRSDFWKVIKDPKQREMVARFFAAGIVAENPQKFGMKKDRPISELYRNLMGN